MDSAARWRTLSHDQPGVPLLLLKADFNNDGYDVRLSDLSSIWTESLDRKGLYRRAVELKCSIDPSEDEQQYAIFTKSIREALSQEAGSTIQLKHTRSEGLLLALTKTLPKPLTSLSWEIRLKHADQTQIKTELVQPLLNAASGLKLQRQLLFAEIAAKDHVISRLTDRLETTGMPLAEIFPNVAGLTLARRQDISKDKLAQHVRGLGTFDSEAWSLKHAELMEDDVDMDRIARVVEGLHPSAMTHARSESSPWWSDVDFHLQRCPEDDVVAADSIKTDPSQRSNGHNGIVSSQLVGPSQLDVSDSSTDDELEVMVSPPPKKHVRGADNTGADKPKVQAQASPIKRQLGTIGGQNAAKIGEGETMAHAENRGDLPKARVKLGTIGGKAKEAARQSPLQASENSGSSKTLSGSPVSPPVRQKSAFTIGGKRAQAANTTTSASRTPAQEQPREQSQASAATVNSPPTIDEIPLEVKADTKRDELKRQLEQKPAPTRKKRKF